ncbi:MAG: TonB-dependent receptor [Acidobacteria bacterium]|nr:TonB-dependent receptor [Acidobacteriota bacterium]
MRLRIVFSILTLLFLIVSTIEAQSSGTLRGTVTDPTGAAIPSAEISAQQLDPAGNNPLQVKSGPDGHFSMELPAGRYRVRVQTQRSSFARTEKEFILNAGENREWNVRLELEKMSATVIVSAEAQPAHAEDVAAPTSIITREEIARRGALSLGALLATTPGVAISRLGREGGVTSLFLNGGNSNFTKVLLDGATINEPGGAIDFSSYALDNIEKVEIVRGAESALYGSDAMTGVVQIFTRRGTTQTPSLELTAEGGSFSTGHGSAVLSGEVGHFDYSVAAARFNTLGQGPNDSFRNTTLSGNFGWKFSERDSVHLSLRSNASAAGAVGQTLFAPPNLDQSNGLRNFATNLSWDFQTGNHWRHHVAGTESYTRQLFDNPTSDFCFSTPPFICDFAFTSRNQFNRAGFNAQSSYSNPRGGITFGYQYEVENGFLSGIHARRNNQGGYVEARLLLLQRLTLTAGARAEANTSFGTRVVPRVGMSYVLHTSDGMWGATRLRFSFGLGIKEPRLDQSFGNDPCFPGNPGLRPERSRAVNVGFEQVVANDRVRVSVDYFDNGFRDITSFTSCFFGGPCPLPQPPACTLGFYGTFFNTDRARARGANVALESRPVRWLRVGGSYSFVASRVLESPNAFDPALAPGNHLFKRPTHSGNLYMNGDWGNLNWMVSGTFVGRRTDSDFLSVRFTPATCVGPCLSSNAGYGRVDVGGNYRLSRNLNFFLHVENLFDKAYQDSLGYQESLVGRSHECDFPIEVKRLPVCTSPKVNPEQSSGEIDRAVKSILADALSVYRVDVKLLDQLRPDVVITQSQCEVCAVSLRDVEQALCNWVGSRPRIVSLEPNALADVWNDIALVAEALGDVGRGKRLVEQLRSRMDAIVSQTCKLTSRPTVACIEWIDPLMAAGNWVPELVEMAGGTNLFGEAGKHSPWMTWEELQLKDPDVIVVLPCGFDIPRSRQEMPALSSKPGWADLRAVKDKRVYLADGNQYFNRPGPRLAVSLEVLAEIFHPEVFKLGFQGRGWESYP